MDVYSIFKFLHVAAAMAWVGGGVTLFAMVLFAERAKDDAEMMRILGSVGLMGIRWFLPASALTLLFGLVMAFVGNLWTEAFVVIGLAGLFGSFLVGHFVLRVRGMAVGALMAEGRLAEAMVEGRRVISVAKFDYVMLFVVVAVMVLRPAWSDLVTLGSLAAVLAVAAAVFLLPGTRRSPMSPAA